MTVYIDNKILQRAVEGKVNEDLLSVLENEQIEFGWPSLLEFLGQGFLFEDLSPFDQEDPLFELILSCMSKQTCKDELTRLYDQVFVECLTRVKALPQINAQYLLECINSKSLSNLDLFSSTLEKYQKRLKSDPANTMHDLILYLAWDRVCVNFGIIFDIHDPQLPPFGGLEIFRGCLLESFQHITAQGRTTPGFFRLLECLYAYQMRDEKIQGYNEEDWLILCKTSGALKPRLRLSDVYYIDGALRDNRETHSAPQIKVFTSDPMEVVSASVSFAQYIIKQLQAEDAPWHYSLEPVAIECVKLDD